MGTRRLACAAVVAAAVCLGAFVPPQAALATRDYAKKEGKDCGYCHISEKGSGPRTPKGREYEANGHRFGVKSWSTDENERKFLRANSALVVQWYGEAGRLLDELGRDETLPGGRALVEATRERFGMFKRAWLGAAKKLLSQGDRGLPNALGFLVKLESQFGATDEGREAMGLLDGLEKDAARKPAVDAARAREKARVVALEGETEYQLGNAATAKELIEKALPDLHDADFERDVRAVLAKITVR